MGSVGISGSPVGKETTLLLTDARVRNAKPKEKDYRIPEGHGLYLFVTTGGAKLWRWRHRFGGKGQVMSFGAHPGIGISAARDAHETARKVLARNINPMAQKKEQKEQTGQENLGAQPTTSPSDDRRFSKVADEWCAWWKEGKDER